MSGLARAERHVHGSLFLIAGGLAKAHSALCHSWYDKKDGALWQDGGEAEGASGIPEGGTHQSLLPWLFLELKWPPEPVRSCCCNGLLLLELNVITK